MTAATLPHITPYVASDECARLLRAAEMTHDPLERASLMELAKVWLALVTNC